MRRALAIVLLVASVSASRADVPRTSVDALFAAYNQKQSPGCSLGVIRNGSFVFQNSYGQASLELGVPLSSESVFYMASVSKQFTAASVVLAAEQGLLSLDDDIRKYIPELPDYGHRITLRQMLHQTSGFRDFFALLFLAGREDSTLSSPDDVLRLIAGQKGLNNVPGEEFVYSNSNYFLLGVVIKRATGKTLAEFAAANIFAPLGMKNTRFYDDNTVVVPNRVAAYSPSAGGGFRVNWSTVFDIVGSGGLLSDVDDLLLWDRNFYSNRLGKGDLAKQLQTPGTLNSGHEINYGLGLWLGEYRGLKTVEHSGGTFGYRTELLRFPEQNFSVALLCNVSNADAEGLARRVSDLYLVDRLKPDASAAVSSTSLADPAPFVGTYLDPRTQMVYTFTESDGSLVAWGAKLRRLGANEFSDVVGNPIVFQAVDGKMTATLTLQGTKFFVGARLPQIKISEFELRHFAGVYASEELQVRYTISVGKGALFLRFGHHPPFKLTALSATEFRSEDTGNLVFQTSADHRVSGFTVYTQPARGITFRRVR